MDIQTLEKSFAAHFNAKPNFIVRAPGRVNLIGEHTDYNDGFVLPMAIDRAVWIALAVRSDREVRVHSLEYETDSVFSLFDLTRGKGWGEYIKGVAYELQKENFDLRGFDAVITGDIPRGAGLSSSAAVELAAARAFSAASDFEWDAARMAKLAQKAENEWVGVNCGIMDQMASAISKSGYALFLDCRSLEVQYAPLPENISVVILDTSTRRKLVESAYNERRSQCEEAAKQLGVQALRDAKLETLNSAHGLSEIVMRRARHVVTENARVLEAVKALKDKDIKRLGELFNASHESLRDDFEVTNDALNVMADCAREQSSCYGARMTGAGFGGCAVALAERESAEEFVSAVSVSYKEKSGLDASAYVCQASEGASVVFP
ncbi:MAG: galactokinase [Anaerolineales bacterium]|nr:galactokinase [Anaerolineales bacterium]